MRWQPFPWMLRATHAEYADRMTALVTSGNVRLAEVVRERDAAQLSEANAHGQMREAKRNLDRAQQQLERKDAEYVGLVGEMLKLRRRGFEKVTEARAVRPADVETNARERAEKEGIAKARTEYIATAAADLEKQGVAPAVAEREAKKMADEAYGMEPLT